MKKVKFQSTRNKDLRLDSAETIIRGLSDDGGLFVPVEIPMLEKGEIAELSKLDYCERAKRIFAKYMTDFSKDELLECAKNAYIGNFEDDTPTPIVKLGESTYMLELWHGPTCAFKDMALQILPHFLVKSAEKAGDGKKTVILTATSGDTGKAALEGFCDVDGTEIIVFYPQNGVSKIQQLQMQTQKGKNVTVCGVMGNFDDTQTAVKSIFTDENIRAELAGKGKRFSSANSINVGRLLPQIVYYISAYADLLKNGEIAEGETVNVTVPTGNFGNILAAYYAKRMGVPFGKLICASNANNVLTEFLSTGGYNINRNFYLTESPSMDILVSSNLERLLFELCGKDDEYVSAAMESLYEHGEYYITDEMLAYLRENFPAGYTDDKSARNRIKILFDEYSYLCDTHTAVAVEVYEKYREKTGDNTKTIIASTASPYKFPRAVLKAISGKNYRNDFNAAKELERISGLPMPEQLRSLAKKEPRFTSVCKREEMADFVLSTVGGEG
ncbi:MAG: threonine synthase [Oscillospiraceae bacterium]|nr:threonine synthase [Oscillospiraceae bacterium]